MVQRLNNEVSRMRGQRDMNIKVLADVRDRRRIQFTILEDARISTLQTFLGFDVVITVFVGPANIYNDNLDQVHVENHVQCTSFEMKRELSRSDTRALTLSARHHESMIH